MKRLIYSESSLADLEGIFDYIARQNQGAAVSFAKGLTDTCKLIAKNPEMGTRREEVAKGLRLFTHRGYRIFYRIQEGAVRIQRFLHHSRDISRQSFD